MAKPTEAPMTLSFNINEDYYEGIVGKIRAMLTHSNSHGIPVLRPQQPETAENQNALWLDIELIAGEHSITLRVEQRNLYIRGYRRSTDDFFWECTDTHLIPDSHDLRFTGGYVGSNSMGATAGIALENLPLGGAQLGSAIQYLATSDPRGANSQQAARSLLVIVLMMAEGARFRPISDHIAAHYWATAGARMDARMVALVNSWSRLSTAVLQADLRPNHNTPLPNIPQINPSNVYTFGQALAAMGILLVTLQQNQNGGGASRHKREATDGYGRCLMNLDYVRVNDIGGEKPGNLFGTVTVNDGWFTYTFYDRSSGHYEDVYPREFATLTDPSQSHAVSGADSLVVSVDLFDRDSFLSADDKIAQGEIVWDRTVENVTFQNYDKHLHQVVRGDDGYVTVGYSVFSNALSVTIQVRLINGDDEDPAQVYGSMAAYQVLGGSDDSAESTLFKKSSEEYVQVGKGKPIPLTRTVIAASTSDELVITVNLWDHDTVTSGDMIARGHVLFTVQPGTQKQFINGDSGQVQVIITCE